MAFVIESSTVISFAEFQDVVNKDQRLFEANEGLSDDAIDQQLIRATERILSKLRASDWWKSYYIKRDTATVYNTAADVPALNPNRIKQRESDFTDLCVFTALSEYILPSIADFGNQDSAQRADSLFGELITAGDWYDFDNSGTIASSEKSPGQFNLKRVR